MSGAPCHKGASWGLCSSLASVARKTCTSYVDPINTGPLFACRLIALDKHPGVRPNGISDTAQRITSKAVLMTVSFDIEEAMDCLQLCGGQISGGEAAIHAFESEECEAALLVDATNAFNALSRHCKTSDISVLVILPSLSTHIEVQ